MKLETLRSSSVNFAMSMSFFRIFNTLNQISLPIQSTTS